MATTQPPQQPKLGLTFYSLTNEWVSGKYDLESLVKRVAEAGIGPGVEIVGFATIRSFPEVSSDFVKSWRDLLDKYELEPSCLAINIDSALRRDRMLTEDEAADYLLRQLESAHKLGFPTVRTQMGATPGVIAKVVPTAEKYGIKMGMEIHAPEGAASPSVLRVREAYEKIGSPVLGFTPDFSSTMHSLPPGQIEAFIRDGMARELVADLNAAWRLEGTPLDRFEFFAEAAAAKGYRRNSIAHVQMGFNMFGREAVESWQDILPQVVHVHSKFYEIDEAGNEPSIDVPRIMELLVDGGYTGYVSSEWEGHVFREANEVDPIELIQRHHRLERRGIEAALQKQQKHQVSA
ncbi:Sugar phosphate isomerase [Arthrobacter sp. 9AX]|uniref:sugar phosphate isomerase/epimerase family protein n=1 Tax=Arthrobacter sp. 9AX TaxID=2653131 RepID=UPI0012F14001|nr:TIM barrel protein [Arthrobacter sp. 9AX]VXC24682.1 Sugar phosphate isomerase [Arthrobacter sp. 9AX]